MPRKPTKEDQIKEIVLEELNISEWPKMFASIEDKRVLESAEFHEACS